MERKLALLETHKKEVHEALSSIEAEAEKLCSLERPLLDADAMERDRLYSRAEAVSSALLLVSNDLQVTDERNSLPWIPALNALSALSALNQCTPDPSTLLHHHSQSAVLSINEANAASHPSYGPGGGEVDPIAAIVKILNNQLRALTQVRLRVGQPPPYLSNLSLLLTQVDGKVTELGRELEGMSRSR